MYRILPALIAAACAAVWHTGALAARTQHYEWLTNGERSGHLVVEVADDGTRRVQFEFADRGRGPRIEESFAVDERVLLARYRARGRAYMGAPVDERFDADGERAFYVAANGSPEQSAALARALLAAEGGTLELLPGGRASIRRVGEHRFGDETARLYAISGLGFTPEYVWLDERDELFALAGGWMGLVPAGRAELLPVLQEHQDAAQHAYHHSLAERLTHRRDGAWCIVNASVLDVDRGRLVPAQSVRIVDGTIERVGSHRSARCRGVPSVDAGGRTLMPGLWDMHAHVSQTQGLLNIAAGVTAVRDMANDHDRLERLVPSFDDGGSIGPRVVRAGIVDGSGPYAAPTGRLADDLDDALAIVDWYAERSYPQIKLYSSIRPEWVPPLAERIHAHGMRVSGHIPSGMSAEAAVRAGFDEVQHINMVFLNFVAGPDDDTRTPLRFTRVGERAHALDLESEPVQAFIALLAERGTVVDPTVTIFEEMFRHRTGTMNPAFARIADHLPPTVRRGLLSARMGVGDDTDARYAASFRALLDMIRRLHEAGVTLVPGTDTMAGFGLHRELELYVRAGIPAADVLRLATIGSARVAGAEQVGRVAPGHAAELILIDGDPLTDIGAVRRAALVVRGNRLYRPADLYEAAGVTPFVDSVDL